MFGTMMILLLKKLRGDNLDVEWIVIFCTHFQTSFGHTIWTEEVADWRNCF